MNEDMLKYLWQHGPWACLCAYLLWERYRLQTQNRLDAREMAEQVLEVIKSTNSALSQLSVTGDALADRITAQHGLLEKLETFMERLERVLDRRK